MRRNQDRWQQRSSYRYVHQIIPDKAQSAITKNPLGISQGIFLHLKPSRRGRQNGQDRSLQWILLLFVYRRAGASPRRFKLRYCYFCIRWYNKVATQIQYFRHFGVYFYLLIKMHALFSHTVMSVSKNLCRSKLSYAFFVRSLGCALFYFRRMKNEKIVGIGFGDDYGAFFCGVWEYQ